MVKYIVRADGVEHGKGTLVAYSIEEVIMVVSQWLDGVVGAAGERIIIETVKEVEG